MLSLKRICRISILICCLLTTYGCCFNFSDEDLMRAKELLSSYPVVDGHNDLPIQYRGRVKNDLYSVNLRYDMNAQWGDCDTDIPRLREGRVGGQFWSVYVSCNSQYKDSVRATLEQIDVVKRLVEIYPDTFEMAYSADDIERIMASGKIASLIGMEGGHSIDSSFGALRMFYDLGARYMTLTHTCHTPWADAASADESVEHFGLTHWGIEMVHEMNRLGMLVDLSHVSTDTAREALEFSWAPVIFSHSSVFALSNHYRNVPDDVLDLIKENGGIIMNTLIVPYLDSYPSDNRTVDVSLVADHMDYVKNRIGVDHLGIGGDYDGMPQGPIGMEDVSTYPNLFAELIHRGWSNEDLKKVANQNIIRVLREAERVRDTLAQEGLKINTKWIPENDIKSHLECRNLN